MTANQRFSLSLVLIAVWGQSILNHNPTIQADPTFQGIWGLACTVCFFGGLFWFSTASSKKREG